MWFWKCLLCSHSVSLSCVYAFQFEKKSHSVASNSQLDCRCRSISTACLKNCWCPGPTLPEIAQVILICRKVWKLPVMSDALVLLLENFSTFIFQRVYFQDPSFVGFLSFIVVILSFFSFLKLLPFFLVILFVLSFSSQYYFCVPTGPRLC